MEIILNELSLNGCFLDEEDFLNLLPSFIKKLKMLSELSYTVLKNYEFYNSKVTPILTIHDLLKKSKDDRIRRFKSLLSSLTDNPYWEDAQRHNKNDSYKCVYTEKTSNYGLAEACERDKVVLSFVNQQFDNQELQITKNCSECIKIHNISETFLEYLFENGRINELIYCIRRFKGSKLDFSKYEAKYGFEILEPTERKIFISSFLLIGQMEWEDIYKSDSLRYKKYEPNSKNEDWFKSTKYAGKVDKFRVSEKFRVFGLKEGDKFYVLRFENDHKKSDKG